MAHLRENVAAADLVLPADAIAELEARHRLFGIKIPLAARGLRLKAAQGLCVAGDGPRSVAGPGGGGQAGREQAEDEPRGPDRTRSRDGACAEPGADRTAGRPR